MNSRGTVSLLAVLLAAPTAQGWICSSPFSARMTHHNFSFVDSQDHQADDEEAPSKTSYKQPQFSESFRKHMEAVNSSFPVNNGEGVDCTGEPSMDPSRMVMDNGLDSEYLEDFN
eukprot:scaffold10556_cov258-Chaetoceros_neogracile.AAC.33